jgi:hypothetical protein
MAVAVPKRTAAQGAPAPSRTAPPEPKKRPRDRPKAGGRTATPRKVRIDDPPRKPGRKKASSGVRAAAAKAVPARKAAPKRKATATRAAAASPAPARRSPARRKTAPKRRTPAGVIPIAAGHAGRAAVAVTQLPESGLIHRLTRGRLWIGLLGLLLVGIVALNVVTLSFAASSGKIDAKNTLLGKENSMLESRAAQKYGLARQRSEAVALGLKPSTDAVPQMVTVREGDVAEAAARLAAAAPAAGAATGEGEASGGEDATGGEAASTEGAVATEETGSVEGAEPGAESTEDLSQFTPEQIEGFEREYAELLAAEGVTEVPAG